MADQQAGLLASPSWYDNLEQPQQRSKELAVQLDSLLWLVGAIAGRGGASPGGPLLGATLRRGFLL